MKTTSRLLLSVALGLVLFVGATPAEASSRFDAWNDDGWHKDLQAAFAEAEEREAHLLVYLGATWCGACRKYDRQVLSDERFPEKAGDYVLVALDVEDREAGTALSRRFGSGTIPFTLVLDRDQVARARINGYRDLSSLFGEIRRQEKRSQKALERYGEMSSESSDKELRKLVDELVWMRDGKRLEQACDRLLERDPARAEVGIERAYALYLQGDTPGALNALDEVQPSDDVDGRRGEVWLMAAQDLGDCAELVPAMELYVRHHRQSPYRAQLPKVRQRCAQ